MLAPERGDDKSHLADDDPTDDNPTEEDPTDEDPSECDPRAIRWRPTLRHS